MSAQSTAIAAHFTPVSMNAEQYDEVIRKLEDAGAGNPPGRLFHLCYGDRDNLRVLEVYDSPESLQAFGQTLMPILEKAGVDLSGTPPDIAPAYSIITAAAGVPA